LFDEPLSSVRWEAGLYLEEGASPPPPELLFPVAESKPTSSSPPTSISLRDRFLDVSIPGRCVCGG
ncbi:hypothetical protein PISMIDRAFT_672662, partial [Pisolithus microcarpus 441]